jgi:1-acyl-sn-glycerol-3-phosphate acyltransferase
MSDAFYNLLWYGGYPAFWVSSSPTVLNAQVTRRPGAYILAANHFSPYDIPLLMRHTARNLDFVSIVEVFRNPFVGWLYGSMNAFPLDRSKPDAPTVRIILDRLARGRAVAMFPEGQFRSEANSVVTGGPIRPGIGRIALLAAVPVIPCVLVNSKAYSKFGSWLPLRRTWYGIHYGQPLEPDRAILDAVAAAGELEGRLCQALRALYVALLNAAPDQLD